MKTETSPRHFSLQCETFCVIIVGLTKYDWKHFLCSTRVSILDCHSRDRGSIPLRIDFFSFPRGIKSSMPMRLWSFRLMDSLPRYFYSWGVIKEWGIALAWDKPRPDEGKGVKARFNTTYPMGGKGGQLNMISAHGLKLSDSVWYNGIYYIAYSHNPKGA